MKRILFLSFLLFLIGTSLHAKKKYQFYYYVEESGNNTSLYEDSIMSVILNLGETKVNMQIKNKINIPIIIDWERSTLTTLDNIARRCLHKGVLLKDRSNPQSPTIIPPQSIIEDTMIPADNYVANYDFWKGFNYAFAPIVYMREGKKFGEASRDYIFSQQGEKIIVMLAFQINEKYLYKTFHIVITEFEEFKD